VESAGGEAADGGSYDPVVSRDGRTVAFWSEATGLVAGDGNAMPDVFVRDRRKGRTVRASVSTAGAEGNGSSAVPCLHPAGRFVVFYTLASNLAEDDTNGTYDVALHDLRRGTTRILSRDGTGAIGEDYSYSFGSSLSSNGRWLAFTSEASNLAPGGDSGEHYNVFVVRTR
jgi:Tol biopolymer transport system component